MASITPERFIELKNKVLYATIEPTNNVLELLSNHFKNRLKNTKKKRDKR